MSRESRSMSFGRLPGFVGALLAVLLVCACAERPTPAVLVPVAQTVPGATTVPVRIATIRQRSKTQNDAFTAARAMTLGYESYDVSIPPTHKSGQIEWPSELPGDPAKNFVVLRAGTLDRATFTASLSGEVVVFVHGYNTNYQEGVFRAAQLVADKAFPGTLVEFAWPSQGALTGYFADRESAIYSRDYLEQVLNDIAARPGVTHIHLVAHSMGNWLAVETLRQARLRSRSPFLAKLGEVFLMSPDIDIDVFRTQLEVIGKLNRPITVLISRDDLALAASQRLAFNVPRVGNAVIDDPKARAAIEKFGLRVIDLSDVSAGDTLAHSKFLNVLPALREVVASDAKARAGDPISRTGLFVADTAGTILLSPLRLGQAVLGQPLIGE